MLPPDPARRLQWAAYRWFVEISVFRKLDEQAVVKLAIELYQILGGVMIENLERSDVWRRDENSGGSAVYQISHGYHIAKDGQGISVIITENWAETHADDRLIASAYTVKACDAIDLVVKYRNGMLICQFSGDASAEEMCRERVQRHS